MSTPAEYVQDKITASSSPQPHATGAAPAALEMVFSGQTAKRKHADITTLLAQREKMQRQEEEILAQAKALRAQRDAADQLLIDASRSQIVDSIEALKAKIVTLTDATFAVRDAMHASGKEIEALRKIMMAPSKIMSITETRQKYMQYYAEVVELVRSLKTKVDALNEAVAELEQLQSKLGKPGSAAAASSTVSADISSAAAGSAAAAGFSPSMARGPQT